MHGTNKKKIAIDGPAGSGKSTTAELLRKQLHFTRINSGNIYRAITFALQGRDYLNEEVKEEVEKMEFSCDLDRIFHIKNGISVDISDSLRTKDIDERVCEVAKELYIRNKVHRLQVNMIKESKRGVIIEGRDIGTEVMPDADLKVFLTAKPETRARRRYEECTDMTYEEIYDNIIMRDHEDSTRKYGPLRIAEDAFVLYNDSLSTKETVERIIEVFNERTNKTGNQ